LRITCLKKGREGGGGKILQPADSRRRSFDEVEIARDLKAVIHHFRLARDLTPFWTRNIFSEKSSIKSLVDTRIRCPTLQAAISRRSFPSPSPAPTSGLRFKLKAHSSLSSLPQALRIYIAGNIEPLFRSNATPSDSRRTKRRCRTTA
jgi:hypothetical protein